MAKLRYTRTMAVEFDFIPEYYPEGTSAEEAAKMDCNNTNTWEDLFLCELESDTVSYEVVDNGVVTAKGEYKYE